MSGVAVGGDCLAGRVAIVTGASGGIGRATAVALAARGARILAVGRNAERLAAVAAEAGGVPLAISIATPEGCAEVAAAARRLGRPGVLVNNAGLGGYLDGSIEAMTTAGWRETMAVNLDAPFELCRHFARDIREQGGGRIVMVSSTAGEIGAPSMAAYCASKHGLIGLMRSVAQDVAPHGGTCNAVLPSWVRTEMAERDTEQEARKRGLSVEAVWAERAAANPAGRIVTAEEVAATIAFLASPAASAINGQAITVSLGALW